LLLEDEGGKKKKDRNGKTYGGGDYGTEKIREMKFEMGGKNLWRTNSGREARYYRTCRAKEVREDRRRKISEKKKTKKIAHSA